MLLLDLKYFCKCKELFRFSIQILHSLLFCLVASLVQGVLHLIESEPSKLRDNETADFKNGIIWMSEWIQKAPNKKYFHNHNISSSRIE